MFKRTILILNEFYVNLFLDDEMTDCAAYHSLSPFLPIGLYRIKLPVVDHVTSLCEMNIDGGCWTVSAVCIRKTLFFKIKLILLQNKQNTKLAIF